MMIMGIKRHFSNISFMSYVCFIGGKLAIPGEKLTTCHKLLTNFTTFTHTVGKAPLPIEK
jgi:hypothetical protein